MKKILMISLVGIVGIIIGYFIRHSIYTSPLRIHSSRLSSHSDNDLFTLEDIVAVNHLIDNWLSTNRDELHPESSISVLPEDSNGYNLRLYRLSDAQQDEVSALVHDYFDGVILVNRTEKRNKSE